MQMATNVATENTEHDGMIRKVGFPTGLVGGDQHCHRELLAQPLGRTASRLPDTPRQTSYIFWSYGAYFHGFHSHPLYSVASETHWVCNESVPSSPSVESILVL